MFDSWLVDKRYIFQRDEIKKIKNIKYNLKAEMGKVKLLYKKDSFH